MNNVKYCYKCGAVLDLNAKSCHACGTEARNIPEDKAGFWASLCACGNWVVGLVLFLVWKDTKPKSAKTVCIISAVSTVIIFGLAFFMGLISELFYYI